LDWGRLTKYHDEKDKEAVRMEKELRITKKRDVRQVLEEQMKERRAASLIN